MIINSSTVYLARPGGRIGYDISGEGPLVILVPGMGDLRTAYRFLAPALREARYRVACTDLRGHGASDATFASYGDVETAGDVIALIEELKEPAVVLGNSMGAGAAAFGAGLSRTMLATYLPAFFAAGALCIIAALMTLSISRAPKPVAA